MKNIRENNRLIAEFMGTESRHPLWQSPSYAGGKFWVSEEFMGIEEPDGNELLDPSEMKFHTSWDWLMPVIEKIRSRGFTDRDRFGIDFVFSGVGGYFYAEGYRKKLKVGDKYGYGAKTKIENCFLTVVQAIKKINENEF